MEKIQQIILKQKLQQMANGNQLAEAETFARQLLQQLPKDLEIWFALGQIQANLGKSEQALYSFMKSVQSKSAVFAPGLSNIAEICIQLEKFEDGLTASKALSEEDSTSALAFYQCGYCYWRLRKVSEAESYYAQAIALEPDNNAYMLALAEVYAFTGRIDRSLENLDKIKSSSGNQDDSVSIKHIMYSNYSDQLSEDEVSSRHAEFGAELEARYADSPELKRVAKPDKKIRIGYVSPDFRRHSVSYFFLPIIRGFDRDRFEVYCYSDVVNSDSITQSISELSTKWRDTTSLSNSEMFAQIRKDEIDILVDLVSYTENRCRLKVFARKAAPIQVSYLGYPNTTGLGKMDYRLVDGISDPQGESDSLYTEKLYRLPNSFLCFSTDDNCPNVSPLPALENETIVFGSFNSYLKITDRTLALWSKILKRVDNAKLYIKAEIFADQSQIEACAIRCQSLGIDRERLIIKCQNPSRNSHLSEYHNVDIHLDSFPYNGTTTTMEAMWMGVPTVTLAGNSHRSRVGASILTNAGMEDYVASDESDYVEIAASKASDLKRLSETRLGLRERLSASVLMNESKFVASLEGFFNEVYDSYIDGNNRTK